MSAKNYGTLIVSLLTCFIDPNVSTYLLNDIVCSPECTFYLAQIPIWMGSVLIPNQLDDYLGGFPVQN